MREFILLALKARTSPDFSFTELPKAGKMDLVCRTVSNTLWISHAIRKDTTLHIVMNGPRNPPKIISFYGEKLSKIETNDDEITIARIIKKALKKGIKLNLNEKKEVMPGVEIAKKAFETLIKEKIGSTQLVYLHPKGEDIRKAKFKEKVTFVFGDFIGLPKKTEKLLKRLEIKKISIGPKVLFASHCPIIVHNELDRRQNLKLSNI